jgi:hypothetical protein
MNEYYAVGYKIINLVSVCSTKLIVIHALPFLQAIGNYVFVSIKRGII